MGRNEDCNRLLPYTYRGVQLIDGSGVEEEALGRLLNSGALSRYLGRLVPMRPPRNGAGVRFPARLEASASKR